MSAAGTLAPGRCGISSGVGKLFPVLNPVSTSNPSSPSSTGQAKPLVPLLLRTLFYQSTVDASVPCFSAKLRVMLIYKASHNSIAPSLLATLADMGRCKLKDPSAVQLLSETVQPPLPGHGNGGAGDQLVTFYNSSSVEVWDGLDVYLLQVSKLGSKRG